MNSSATASAIAKGLVRPGLLIPDRLITLLAPHHQYVRTYLNVLESMIPVRPTLVEYLSSQVAIPPAQCSGGKALYPHTPKVSVLPTVRDVRPKSGRRPDLALP